MPIEIELKAWVEDPAGVTARIAAFAGESGNHEKNDAYWLPLADFPAPGKPAEQRPRGKFGSGIRIRWETESGEQDRGAGVPATETALPDRAIINFKQKEVRDGIEVNDEREFTVEGVAQFEALLDRLGFALHIRKRKTGKAWTFDGITIELSEIDGLGLFVELEILADTDTPEVVRDARSRLLALLERIGVDPGKIETRYYTSMLAEKRQHRGL